MQRLGDIEKNTEEAKLDALQYQNFSTWLDTIGQFLFEVSRDCAEKPLISSSPELHGSLSKIIDAPSDANDFSEVLKHAISLFEKGNCNVFHPLYFGYISPRPHPFAVLGDFLASGLNQTPGAWRAGPAATLIEVQVLHWFRELFNLPKVKGNLPGGIFTGGGTIANTVALKIARDQILGEQVQKYGISNLKLRVYTSLEGHFSLDKAMDTLGLGTGNLVKVATDKYGAMIVNDLGPVHTKC